MVRVSALSLLTLAWMVLGLCAACDETTPPDTARAYTEQQCTRTGAATVATPYGPASVVLLDGSYQNDEPLCVQQDYAFATLPIGFQETGVRVAVTPYGARLDRPVTLSLPQISNAPLAILRRDRPDSLDWEVTRLPLDTPYTGVISFTTDRLGIFVLAFEYGRPLCEVTNRCGGCAVLEAEPGTPCGPCGLDLFACANADTIVCNGYTTNACGGCGTLSIQPGEACGQCGLDAYQCISQNDVACSGDSTNGCGGCAALPGEPGNLCGQCGLGVWSCEAQDAVECVDDEGTNACGGCEPLAGEPNQPCGLCSAGAWSCSGAGTVCVNGSSCDEPQYARVEAGVDMLGLPPDQDSVTGYEEPARMVTISRPFWLQKTEVTREQWSEVMGVALSGDGKLPQSSVSVWAVAGYLNRLSARESLAPCYACRDANTQQQLPCENGDASPLFIEFTGLTCQGYRLPTEAEWEYAARAGADALYPTGGEGSLPRGAWFNANALGQPHPVAQRAPNEWGLYDMAGNSWEFVWGIPGSAGGDPGPITDPLELWNSSASQLAMRGGSYVTNESHCRSSSASPALVTGHPEIGFRAARTIFE